LYVTTCTQETEKARQYDRQLKQMKAERDKAEKVLMEQLESYGEEDNEESERSRQLIRNFQKKVNRSVKDDGRKQVPKRKTRSQPKKITKKKTMKKKTPTRKDTSDDEADDEATETEPEPSEIDWEEVVEVEVDSDNEEVQAEVDSDNEEVQAEVDSDNDKEAESDADEIKIKSHRFVKGVCWVKTKFADEDGISDIEVWWLWYEFKNQLREYIKRRKLKGNAWNEPNANHATKIVAVLGHQKKQLHILWNNGYHEWAAERIVLAEKQSFVKDDLLDAYWQGQEKEPVKKSKIKKTKKK
jgi:hypothetical protein